MKGCSVEECKNNARAKGYCMTHYHQILKYGKVIQFNCKKPIIVQEWRRGKPCCIDGCESKAICKAMCGKHYKRVKTHGSPHVSLTRKYKDKPDSMMREEKRYRLTADEKECLSDYFSEATGVNEGENVFVID